MKSQVIIIAEAGVNHNGDFQNAIRLIEVAAEAGADYVKFQTFKTEKIVSSKAQKAKYQIENMGDGDSSQFSMLKNLEMPESWHYKLARHAEKMGIKFLSTGFDEESIDFLDSLGVDFFKIPSGEITNKPYLEHIASKRKPVVISTGMATLSEIKEAVDVFVKSGLQTDNISVLHCNTEYPTPFSDVNLLAMNFIGQKLGVKTGYSDHTLGIEVPIASVALGATIIEKHFTLDKNMLGPDHAASLEPAQLKEMVRAIRNIEKAISGSGSKEPSDSEIKNRDIIRKSLHFSRDMHNGELINRYDLIALRPGTGVSPMAIDTVIGKALTTDVEAFQLLDFNHIK